MESTTPTIETKICNSIILLPWLAKVLIKNKAGTMGNAFIITLQVVILLDTIEVQEAGNTASGIGRNVEEITSLLQHLYYWAQDAVHRRSSHKYSKCNIQQRCDGME
eukprot:5510048-Ditylum_brightwellii.AAC.1